MRAASSLRRHGTIKPGGRGITLSALDDAYRYGRSIFPSRVFDPDEVARVLKDGHQSRKIGKYVDKGPRKGWPIFTLTLEERATCPRNCLAWAVCFGNNMQAAERITAGPDLEQALEAELRELSRQHPGGFLVRLHVLGDFYSEGYVDFWFDALRKYPALHVFGFTAHRPESDIGGRLFDMAATDWSRFAIRFSGLAESNYGSVLEGNPGADGAIPCPAQTGQSDCCATCMLCVHSRRSIMFGRH